jgi:hypothetical protein
VNTITATGQGQQTTTPGQCVTAVAYPPCGRRRLTTLIVTRCPYCSYAHVHRGAPGQRAAGCDPRRVYTLAVAR